MASLQLPDEEISSSTNCNAIIVDDHLMVAQAIATVVSMIADIEIVGIAKDVPEACKLIESNPPEILFLDINLEHENHLDIASCLLRVKPFAKIVIISGYTKGYVVPNHLKDSILALIDKSSPWEGLATALKPWSKKNQNKMVAIDHLTLAKIKSLPKRMIKVFNEIGKGDDNKNIARTLGLTKNTVESYRKYICKTMEISGAQLIRIAALYRSLYWIHQD